MTAEAKSIRQRAQELQKLLVGHDKGPPPAPFKGSPGLNPGRPEVRARAEPLNPDQHLVTPPQYTAAWASSEAIVVTTVIDAFLEWVKSFALKPCQVQGAMVNGHPGCVSADPLGQLITQEFMKSKKLEPDPTFRDRHATEFNKSAVTEIVKKLEAWRQQLAPMALNWFPPYAAPQVVFPPGIPNVPCHLEELARTGAHELSEPSLEWAAEQALTPEWANLYQVPGRSLKEQLPYKVCHSIAAQLAKFFNQFAHDSMVMNVLARRTNVATVGGPVPVPMPFIGETIHTSRGFIVAQVTWRPEWGR